MNKIKKRKIESRIKKNKTKLVSIIVVVFVLLLGVSYAAFTTTLSVDGNATIKSDTCKDKITGNFEITGSWGDGTNTINAATLTINNNDSDVLTDWEAVISGPADMKIISYNSDVTEDNGISTLKQTQGGIDPGKSFNVYMQITSVENPIKIKSIKINGCTIYGSSEEEDLTSIKFSESNYTLKIGEEKEFNLLKTPSNSTKAISFKSSDENIVKINSNKIIGVGAGEATITASYKDLKAEATVTVSNEEIKLESISLTPSSYEMNIDDVITLIATKNPENAVGDIIWKSSNPSVAKVINGKVTGIGVGTAIISASVGNIKGTTEITVTESTKSKIDIAFTSPYHSDKDVQYKMIITNKSTDPIKFISFRIDVPKKTKWTYWNNAYANFKESEDGTLLTSENENLSIASGSYIEFTGSFTVPDGYNAKDYTKPKISSIKIK